MATQGKLASKNNNYIFEMYLLIRKDILRSYKETSSKSRKSKFFTAIWALVFTTYTVADDIPAGFIFSAVESSTNKFIAAVSVGTVSAILAVGLALVQRKRKIDSVKKRKEKLFIKNDDVIKDLISTYGIGSPATVLGYNQSRVPTIGRTYFLSGFYGYIGQGASYVGFESVGQIFGLPPKLALAIGIFAAVCYRYFDAVKQERKSYAKSISKPKR